MGLGDIEDQKDTPLTGQILTEAERRIQERSAQNTPQSKRNLAERLNRVVYWLSKHWVTLFSGLVSLYLAGAVLAPVFMHLGLTNIARILYAFYAPSCHQYPFRSWFLFGPHFAYPLKEPIAVFKMNELSSFIGNADMGYKMALCERDVAIYGMIVIGGLIYAVIRRKRRISPLPLWAYFVFGMMPMMLDGGVQWISYFLWTLFPALIQQPFETIPLLRTITGGLFGLSAIAVTYPYFNEYFQGINETLRVKFGWR